MIGQNSAGGRIKVDARAKPTESGWSKAALGLTMAEAENAFARAMVDDGELTADDIALVLEEKRQIIRKSGLLEFVEANVSLDDVGGLENLKRWLGKRERLLAGRGRGLRPARPQGRADHRRPRLRQVA